MERHSHGLTNMKRNRPRHAFSLLELVAVVTLVGIVATVVLVRLQATDRGTAITNTTTENLRLIQGAIERYNFDNGSFPTSITDLMNGGYLSKAPPILEPGKSYSIDNTGTAIYQ